MTKILAPQQCRAEPGRNQTSATHWLPVIGTNNNCLPNIGGEAEGIFLTTFSHIENSPLFWSAPPSSWTTTSTSARSLPFMRSNSRGRGFVQLCAMR